MNNQVPPGTIQDGEYHPAADSAMAWLKGYMVQHPHDYAIAKESLASSERAYFLHSLEL